MSSRHKTTGFFLRGEEGRGLGGGGAEGGWERGKRKGVRGRGKRVRSRGKGWGKGEEG